jgi:hypothetical protein
MQEGDAGWIELGELIVIHDEHFNPERYGFLLPYPWSEQKKISKRRSIPDMGVMHASTLCC